MRSPVVVATLAVTLLAACSGDDDAQDLAGTTTMDTTTTADTTTTTADTTTTTADMSPTTTTADMSTTTTTADMSTTTVENTTTTPTTLDPAQDPVAAQLAIVDTARESWRVYRAVLADPFSDSKVAALEMVYTGNQLEGWQNIVNEYRANNYRTTENPEVPESYDVDPFSIELDLDAGTASVFVCHRDSSVKVEVGGNPDGSDLVLDDSVITTALQLDLVISDGTWKVSSVRRPDGSGVKECS